MSRKNNNKQAAGCYEFCVPTYCRNIKQVNPKKIKLEHKDCIDQILCMILIQILNLIVWNNYLHKIQFYFIRIIFYTHEIIVPERKGVDCTQKIQEY